MASTKTAVKTIRISNEAVEFYNGKPLNRMVESLKELIEIGKVTENSGELSVCTPKSSQSVPQDVVDDISGMLKFMNTDLEEFMRAIDDTLIAGELDLVDGKIKSVHQDINLDRFLEACHDLNLDPQKTLEKLTESLFRTR